jgi:hypothetical protein
MIGSSGMKQRQLIPSRCDPKAQEGKGSMTTDELVDRGRQIYDDRYKATLEQTHLHWFVAIEPESGEYFLGRTLGEAAAAARAAHPDRRAAAFWIGHRATMEFACHTP